ncbi:hypothetical protein [Kitasatospora sp. NPDC088548]|uniref:hypothetical protein n=1 Tax=Kitasatospora sp. NPDC088548 TaxID=3364075 RepID=UPI003807C232
MRTPLLTRRFSLGRIPSVFFGTISRIDLVFPPTYGSWLNWIEPEFAALRYFALNGTAHRNRDEQNAAIGAHIRWHNAKAERKTSFAPDSPVHSWSYDPAKAA